VKFFFTYVLGMVILIISFGFTNSAAAFDGRYSWMVSVAEIIEPNNTCGPGSVLLDMEIRDYDTDLPINGLSATIWTYDPSDFDEIDRSSGNSAIVGPVCFDPDDEGVGVEVFESAGYRGLWSINRWTHAASVPRGYHMRGIVWVTDSARSPLYNPVSPIHPMIASTSPTYTFALNEFPGRFGATGVDSVRFLLFDDRNNGQIVHNSVINVSGGVGNKTLPPVAGLPDGFYSWGVFIRLNGTLVIPASTSTPAYTVDLVSQSGFMTRDHPFLLDTTPPSILVQHDPSAPNSDSIINISSMADDGSIGSGIVQVQVFVNNILRETCMYSSKVAATCDTDVGPFPAGTTVSYFFTVQDRAGNVATSTTRNFTVTAGFGSVAPIGDVSVNRGDAIPDLVWDVQHTVNPCLPTTTYDPATPITARWEMLSRSASGVENFRHPVSGAKFIVNPTFSGPWAVYRFQCTLVSEGLQDTVTLVVCDGVTHEKNGRGSCRRIITPPINLRANPTGCGGLIHLEWDPVWGAEHYEVSSNNGTTWQSVGNVTNHIFHRLPINTNQTVQVRAAAYDSWPYAPPARSAPSQTNSDTSDMCRILGGYVSDCIIPRFQSTCRVPIFWNMTGGPTPFLVTNETTGVDIGNTEIGSAFPDLIHGTNTISSYSGGDLIRTITRTAACDAADFFLSSTNMCRERPVIEITPDPTTVRSGDTAQINIDITAGYNLECSLLGGISPTASITHASSSTRVRYTITTVPITHSRILRVSCNTRHPDEDMRPREIKDAYIRVVPRIQES